MAETATRRKARGFREHSARASVYLILFVAGLVVLIPFLLAFFGSFKTSEDISTYPPRLLPYAPTTVNMYAMAAMRHMHEYGTTREQLAEIAVSTRYNASLNPDAYYRDPITIEDVQASDMIADPLTKLHCCIRSDGGGAIGEGSDTGSVTGSELSESVGVGVGDGVGTGCPARARSAGRTT